MEQLTTAIHRSGKTYVIVEQPPGETYCFCKQIGNGGRFGPKRKIRRSQLTILSNPRPRSETPKKQRGRPKKESSREQMVTFRMTRDELEGVLIAARALGMTRSNFIRAAVKSNTAEILNRKI